MIEHLSRPLTQSEIRRVRADLARIAKRSSGRFRLKEFAQANAAACVVGVGYGVFANYPMTVALAGAAAVANSLLCISWFENWRKQKPQERALQAVLSSLVAQVVHVKASAFAAFPEYEDLGALYAFQTGPNELLILRGQHYYESEGFPCLEFELVEVPGAFHAVRALGGKAKPAVTYTEAEMLSVARVEDKSVVQGEVGHALSALRGGAK